MLFRSSLRAAVAGVAALLLLAACSDDDGPSAEAAPYVDALAAELAEPADEGALVLPEEAARCFAEGVVDVLDVERLSEAGVTPAEVAEMESFVDLDVEVDDDAQGRVADAATDCFDVRGSLAESFQSVLGVDVSCLADEVDEDRVADAFAEQFTTGGSPETDQALLDDMLDEMSPACGEEIFLGGLVAQGLLDDAQQACAAEQLDDELARKALILSPGEADEDEVADINEAINAAFAECGVAAPGD